jgi:GDP-D-mannose 3',5'-epimerase
MKILVAGAGGFIGGHLTKHLAGAGHEVTAVDIKKKDSWHQHTEGVKELVSDLKDFNACGCVASGQDRIYNLACNMGGMGFIQNNHVDCLESVLIQTNFVRALRDTPDTKEIFYSSSACAYPQDIQGDVDSPALKESDAFPASPQDGYGWEKLFSEIITRYGIKDCGLNPRIFRFHNCYGPYGTWKGGREKAPAAMCRKVIEAKLSGDHDIEIWGDGEQTRSFMYIDDCITGIEKIWQSDHTDPLNLGSDEQVTVNQLVDIAEELGGIKLKRNYDLSKPQGVRGRNSDNTLIKEVLGWSPSISLREGMEKTYEWIYNEVKKSL